jgi:hypothetical protein
MTASDRFDVLLADALDDLAAPHYPDYFDVVLDRAVRRTQRPAWTFPERWLPMSTLARGSTLVPALPWRAIGLILVLVALLAVAFAVTVGQAPSRNPAPPFGLAANGAVAYAVDGDIYVRDTPTSEARLILGGPTTDVFPTFSRQGTQMAFIRLEGEGSAATETLMVAEADGSDARVVQTADTIASADWSTDGTSIALVAIDRGARSLFIASTTDDAAPSEVSLPVPNVYEVDWRPPRGDELVVLAGTNEQRGFYAVRPDGTGFRPVSPAGTDGDFMPPFALSPDGGRLAYTEGGAQVRIRILDLESGDAPYWGEALPALSDGDTVEHWGFPVISPDGTRFAFGRYWDEADGTINHQVFVASVGSDGADAVAVSQLHRSVSGHDPFGYSFAPDGRHVIIQLNDVEETWLADLQGGAPRLLGWGAVMDPPNWQRVAP